MKIQKYTVKGLYAYAAYENALKEMEYQLHKETCQPYKTRYGFKWIVLIFLKIQQYNIMIGYITDIRKGCKKVMYELIICVLDI